MNSVYSIFVYGSLRKGFHAEAYNYISRYFYPVAGDARVKGKLYDLGDYPAAIATDEDHFIIGELYHIADEKEFNWAIEQLDDYEGINVEAQQQAMYKRELTKVNINNETVMAWIYWFAGSLEGRPEIASGDVFDYFEQKNK